MGEIYYKTLGMLLIIALGYLLKATKLLAPQDARVLSKIAINLTLPCVIISNLNGLEISWNFVGAIIGGVVVNAILTAAALLLTKRKTIEERIVFLFAVPLFNISGYAVPVLQSFVSAKEIAVLLLFNLGTTVFTYVIVPSIAEKEYSGGKGKGWKQGVASLGRNVPALTSLTMITLALFRIVIPQNIVGLISNLSLANTAIAMLSIGLLFELPKKQSAIGAKAIATRLSIIFLLGVCFRFAPFLSKELRNALTLVLFAPMVSCAPVLAMEQGYRGSEVACVNSAYLPISVACMTLVTGLLFGA